MKLCWCGIQFLDGQDGQDGQEIHLQGTSARVIYWMIIEASARGSQPHARKNTL